MSEAITAARKTKPTVPSLSCWSGMVLSPADEISTIETPSAVPARRAATTGDRRRRRPASSAKGLASRPGRPPLPERAGGC